ncbi:peptidase [Escherichia coli]|uniref:Peptidase n=1 Tax=Escherichia coli TaxID=562 RepID=A0A377CUY1_ECOLX|nr:peptidase [Escherichia coli]
MIPGHLLICRRVWRSMLLTSHWQKIYALIFVNRHLGHTAFLLASRLILRPKISVICWLLLVNQKRHDELLTLANEVMVKRLAKGISEQELNEYQQKRSAQPRYPTA